MADSEIETCIRYYEGDLPFYGDYRAYITWNSIFFEDCQSERLKVRENKPLNPLLIEQYSDLIQASSGLFRACSASREKRVTTRIERTYDFLEMKKKGYTIAFTSTSKKNFLSSYQDKEGIVLLEFLLPSGTQCIDFSERLSSYTKADEAEVLLPPWTRIQIEEKEMSDREKKILDINGNPPYGKFLVTACGLQKKEKLQPVSFTKEQLEQAVCFCQCLNASKTPDTDVTNAYMHIKKAIRTSIHIAFNSIFYGE